MSYFNFSSNFFFKMNQKYACNTEFVFSKFSKSTVEVFDFASNEMCYFE